jgi:tRNA threonylcarbamoyladenosine biosynthesis protein TsaB
VNPPRVLAIDTTSEFGSIALVQDQNVMAEVALHSPEGFSPIIFGQVQSLLETHGLVLGDLDAFAAASGPGSFTGVRVGLSAIKGLAEATGRQAIGISNLQALASFGSRELRAAVLDARRGEVYGAVYNARLDLVKGETVMKFEDWLRLLPSGDVEIISTGAFSIPAGINLPVVHAPPVLAGAVGRIAAAQIAAGEGRDPAEIHANYVRRSDAELFWRDP